MKKIFSIIIVCGTCTLFSCGKKFLTTEPQATISKDQLISSKGVESSLIGAYGLMNGNISGTWNNYAPAPSQWLLGEVSSDNAHKGSSNQDQSAMNDIELHKPNSANDQIPIMWTNYYEGIARCNTTLSILKELQASSSDDKLSDERAKQVESEARMLRAHYYFYLWRAFKNIPYVDENMTTEEAKQVSNDTVTVYPKIIEDLQFAVANLDYTKPLGDIGRCDKYAAESYLGKVLLYQKKYAEALVLFKDVIDKKPLLTTLDFRNNFSMKGQNGSESIFASQHIVNPDGSGDNGNVGDMLAGLYGSAPISCCGFYQPSIDLANSYKVDANGLPLLDNSYRTNPYKSDLGLVGSEKANYAVDQTIAFDPRIDYTLGRRGVPFRDWGTFPGDAWMRDPAFAGPFVSKKQQIDKADFAGNVVPGTEEINAMAVNIIRLADVYLMAAECAVETGDIPYALARVNDVRNRAANLPDLQINGSSAAAYKVKPYSSFPSADYARNAIHFERRLELALEGQRFYDLVRWGIAKSVLESYMNFEKQYISASNTINFNPDRDNVYPIPQQEIDRNPGVIHQNNGY